MMESIKLNLPRKSTFWVSVVIALSSGILYALQCMDVLAANWVYPLAYLLITVAFFVLVLGLLLKRF